jgi:putative flippase GtrA
VHRVTELRYWFDVSRFVLVGSVGFTIDGGIMLLLMKFGHSVIEARLTSFAAAVTVTWALNRVWTFSATRRGNKRREYLYYLATQLVGAAINLAIFLVCLSLFPALGAYPLIPFVFGASAALIFNYNVSKHFVFRNE